MTKTEIELVTRLQNGDYEAFHQIYEIYYPKCKKQAYMLCRNNADAHDMAQEALLKVYSRISQLKEVTYFEYWLNKIVHSQCVSMFRHNRVASYDPEMLKTYQKEEKRVDHLPDSAFGFNNDQKKVRTLVSELNPKHSEILNLYYFQQLSINEISNITSLPIGTVKSRMFQAKRNLHAKIRETEKVEGYRINFRVEPLLPALFTALMCNLESSTKSTKILKYVQAVSITSCVAVSGVIVKEVIDDYTTPPIVEQAIKEPITTPAPIPKNAFQPITFREEEITNAKIAYYTLIEILPIEADFSTVSNATIKEVNSLVATLQESKTRYWDVLEDSGWLQKYEFVRGD